jgi:hypothetical protein
MPKKIEVPVSKLHVSEEDVKKASPVMRRWFRYAQMRIDAAKKSEQLSAKDFMIRVYGA